MHTISIIGLGRLGGALALALPADKYVIEYLVVRDRERWLRDSSLGSRFDAVREIRELQDVSSETIIIATQDDEIESVASLIADNVDPGTNVFHTSGSLSSTILAPLRSRGCPAGSIHPLVSVSDPELGAARFKGSYFCIEGDPEAVSCAQAIVDDLGGMSFGVDTQKKALYHAAAVMACGHLVALLDSAIGLMMDCGLNNDLAKKVLLPLVSSTLVNVEKQTLAKALTGTFARADSQTFERHLTALSLIGDDRVREIYLLLGDISLDLALENGVDPRAAGDIRKRISMAKSRP